MTENIPSSHKLTPLDMKRLRFWVWVFVIIGVLGVVKACDHFYRQHSPELPYKEAQKQSHDPIRVTRHITINDQELWIPAPYFMHSAPADGARDSALLITMYPDFGPITERYNKLWEEGKWNKNVMLLLSNVKNKRNASDLYESLSHAYEATIFAGKEFGLDHFSQPLNIKNDENEIWIEGKTSDPDSLISCGKQVAEKYYPQCTLYIWQEKLMLTINFDKKLLPYWMDIKNKSLTLLQNFQHNPSSPTSSQGE